MISQLFSYFGSFFATAYALYIIYLYVMNIAIALHRGFAFIQFTKETEARDAMAAENNAQFLGNVICAHWAHLISRIHYESSRVRDSECIVVVELLQCCMCSNG